NKLIIDEIIKIEPHGTKIFKLDFMRCIHFKKVLFLTENLSYLLIYGRQIHIQLKQLNRLKNKNFLFSYMTPPLYGDRYLYSYLNGRNLPFLRMSFGPPIKHNARLSTTFFIAAAGFPVNFVPDKIEPTPSFTPNEATVPLSSNTKFSNGWL